MNEKDVMDLQYAPDDNKPEEVKKVPQRSLKKLYHALLWRDYQASLCQSGLIAPEGWMDLDGNTFDATPQVAVTLKKVVSFRRWHRCWFE